MSIANGNTPAMPYKFDIGGGFNQCAEGLTKREMFAMAAMQGFCQINLTFDSPQVLAEQAVIMADALLAELEQTK